MSSALRGELWPCSTCGSLGVRNLGTRGYCGAHLSDLFRKLDERQFMLRGVGLLTGRERPEFGHGFAELECVHCLATWVGVPGDLCLWCEAVLRALQRYQAELVLRPDLPERTDKRRERAVAAWAEGRLAVAVEAGLVTDLEAERALRREMSS